MTGGQIFENPSRKNHQIRQRFERIQSIVNRSSDIPRLEWREDWCWMSTRHWEIQWRFSEWSLLPSFREGDLLPCLIRIPIAWPNNGSIMFELSNEERSKMFLFLYRTARVFFFRCRFLTSFFATLISWSRNNHVSEKSNLLTCRTRKKKQQKETLILLIIFFCLSFGTPLPIKETRLQESLGHSSFNSRINAFRSFDIRSCRSFHFGRRSKSLRKYRRSRGSPFVHRSILLGPSELLNDPTFYKTNLSAYAETSSPLRYFIANKLQSLGYALNTGKVIPSFNVQPADGDRFQVLVVASSERISKARGSETDGRLMMMEGEILVGEGPPIHVHYREDEYFHVLQGEIESEVGDRKILGRAGTWVYAPRYIIHRYRNVNSTGARLEFVFQQAGIEHYFEEVSRVIVVQ